MTSDRLDQLAEQAKRSTPVVGRILRRRAAWRIWTRGTPQAMAKLAALVTEIDDPALRRYIVGLLDGLTDAHRIDAVATVWAETRHADLAALVERKQWMAAEPLGLRILTALWVGHHESMANAPPAAIPLLLPAAEDREPRIAERAKLVLRSLLRPDARQAVCDAFLDHASEPAQAAALAAGYEPANAARRAVFYFLTGQWTRYESLDFDGSALRSAYEVAGPGLRGRLADVARAAGRIEYVAAAARQGKRVGQMTDVEWESAVAILAGERRWAELWKLGQAGPPAWAARVALRLIEEGVESAPVALEAAARAWVDADASSTGDGRVLAGHAEDVVALAVAADGKTAVTVSLDHTMRVWGVAEGHSIVRQVGGATCLAVSPDGRTLAVGVDDGSITLWGLPEGRPIARLVAHVGGVRAMAVLPTDGGPAVLASGGDDGRVRLFALPDGRELRTLGKDRTPIGWLAADVASGHLATADDAGVVRLWNAAGATVDPAWTVIAAESLTGLTFADGGRTLAVGAQNVPTVLLLRCPAGNPRYDAAAGGGDVTALAAPAGQPFVCVGASGGGVTFIRSADGSTVRTLPPHTAAITAMAASAEGHLLATADAAGGVKLWSLPDGRLLADASDGCGPVRHLAFVPRGGPLLAACDGDPRVRAWDVERLRLSQLPMAEMTPADVGRARALMSADGLGEASPMALVAAVLAERFAHDVIVEDVSGNVVAGEFDIILG